jgi:hypothetical protein
MTSQIAHTVTVYKARPIGKHQHVPNMMIEAIDSIPENIICEGWESVWKGQLDEQAALVVQALVDSLPGGVVNRIYVQLAMRYANQLAIPDKHL